MTPKPLILAAEQNEGGAKRVNRNLLGTAMATAQELVVDEEAKARLLQIIQQCADKSQIDAVIADPSNHLRLELNGHSCCVPGQKFYLVVVGKPPNHFRGCVTHESGSILEIYTYHVNQF